MPVMTTSRAALGSILALGFTALGFVAQGFMAQGLPARAADAPIRVNTFPNAKALPVYVGIARGFFAKYGLSVEVEHTESSQSQRDGLAAGQFQIAQAALDNAVAMIEVAKRDVVIVSGGDSGMNEFFVQPGIASFARSARQDHRGRCARHRLCAAGQEAAAAQRAQGGQRLHGQAGRRRASSATRR